MSTPTSARSCLRAIQAVTCSLLLTAAAAAGCGLISFDTTVDIGPSVVPGSPAAASGGATVMTMTDIPIDKKNLPSNADLADSVKLSSLTLRVTAPAGATLDFLSSMTLTIFAPAASGLPPRQIAIGTPDPGATEVTLKPTGDVDLLPYIQAGAVVRAVGTGRSPAADTTLAGKAVLTVSV
ncbi:MAG TPA: hypothetical protein VMU50_04315 [Polyangia bacterium]|jgi:hypothetical protein|nr:hypothetical protein [Polyangia bacterium]